MDYYSLDERKKLQDKLELENKALDDVIANQGREERDIIDNYNSLGSTLGRMFGAYASVRGGANPSQVLQNYSNQLDTRLNNARNKYKDERESAFNRAKDTLSRLDAYNKGLMEQDKTAYQKERDRIADERADKELGLKEKSLNWQIGQENIKKEQAAKQAEQDQINRQRLEDAAYYNLESLGKFGLDQAHYNKLNDNKKAKAAEIHLFNTTLGNLLNIDPEKQAKWIETNPALPHPGETYAVFNKKVRDILSQLPASDRVKQVRKQATVDATKQLINTAKPGSSINLEGDDYVVSADKTLFKDGVEYALDDKTGNFVIINSMEDENG